MIDKLFTYGTLQFADIFQRISAIQRPLRHARLSGYARYAMRGCDYPAILPQAGGVVEGVLYLGIGPAAIKRLDAFEGSEYRRELVLVEDARGRRLRAWCYILKPEYHCRLTDQPWDSEAFRQNALDRYRR